MKPIIYSQASIFHLSRLGLLAFAITGVRYRLKNHEELDSLIRYCDKSTNPTICRQLETFLFAAGEATTAEMMNQSLLTRPHKQFEIRAAA